MSEAEQMEKAVAELYAVKHYVDGRIAEIESALESIRSGGGTIKPQSKMERDLDSLEVKFAALEWKEGTYEPKNEYIKAENVPSHIKALFAKEADGQYVAIKTTKYQYFISKSGNLSRYKLK